MTKQRGFSLIELLIVVAIILIIAAIAVPNLLKSKMAANEASAAAADRTVGTAEVTYSSTYNTGFSQTLGALGPPAAGVSATSTAADLLDSVLSGSSVSAAALTSTKSGYKFTYIPGAATPAATYTITGTPVATGSTGQSTFCLDQTNVVRKDPTGATTAGAATGCPTAMNPM